MLTPISWLKDFVEIKLPVEKLAEELSAAGLTVEKWNKVDDDIVLDPEITPNRPDWLSVYGIAREISAVTNSKLKVLNTKQKLNTKNAFELKIRNNFELCPRYTAIIIKNVSVKPSPEWLKDRLKKVGLRPINNLVDITNYVMWELGNPLHVFDLDKIRGKQMIMEEAKGGEEFRSLDGINYKLPKGTIIIKDLGRVIDLCGLKGGENTAVTAMTKNILIHVPIYEPVHIRKTSQALGLRSDASAIFEHGADPGNTTKTLERAAEIILDLAGGKIDGGIIDEKIKDFKPWTVDMSHEKLEQVLGIKVSEKQVTDILERLGFGVSNKYNVTVPTFRNDVHIGEDLIEEVGRIIGYNNFPKTLPTGPLPTQKVAYAYDFDFDFTIKQILKGAGYNEIYTYSLVSEDQLIKLGINPSNTLRVDNPISKEYEYLRPSIFGNLLDAIKLNQANFSNIKLFELGKEYKGETCDKAREEYWLWGAVLGDKFYETKGDLKWLLLSLGINYTIRPFEKEDDIEWAHPGRTATIETKDKEYLGYIGEVHPSFLAKWGIKGRLISWELKCEVLKKFANLSKTYQAIPKYPAIIEDLSLTVPDKVLIGEIVAVFNAHKLVNSVDLLDVHEDTKTFRVTYLDPTKNLTAKEVLETKTKILRSLKEKLRVHPKLG